MELFGVSREDVDWILENPIRLTEGTTADEYDAVLRGRLFRVVLTRGIDPPRVITVFPVTR